MPCLLVMREFCERRRPPHPSCLRAFKVKRAVIAALAAVPVSAIVTHVRVCLRVRV